MIADEETILNLLNLEKFIEVPIKTLLDLCYNK